MKRPLLIILLLYVCVNSIKANDELDTFQAINPTTDLINVSLLTCSPGTEIYALFGHTAIRYEDLSKNIDLAFNYGIFSFDTPNFIWRFVKGETDYQLGITQFRNFETEYFLRGSTVYQQTLNLLPEEKQKLWEILSENYQVENRTYRYNYFFDNCTTRARDKIEECLEGNVDYRINNKNLSFRNIIHQYTLGHEWAEFGIDLCLGSQADKSIDGRQQMFAPFYLLNAIDSAYVIRENGRDKLSADVTEVVIPEKKLSEQEKEYYPSPLVVFWSLFAVVFILSIYGIWKRKTLWGLDILLFGSAGIAGCILGFLALFSVHPTVSSNYLLFIFHPIHLIYLPFLIYFEIKRRRNWYHWLNLIVLTLFILLWTVFPQRFNPAVLPLALCLLVRSLSQIILLQKKRNEKSTNLSYYRPDIYRVAGK